MTKEIGVADWMRTRGFTKNPQMTAPTAVLTPPIMQTPTSALPSESMQEAQEMQKADLMSKIVDMVGSANPEVLQMLENAPISELSKALQEMTDAGGVVTKAAGEPIR